MSLRPARPARIGVLLATAVALAGGVLAAPTATPAATATTTRSGVPWPELAPVLARPMTPTVAGAGTTAAPGRAEPRRKKAGTRIGIAYGDTLTWLSDEHLAAVLDDAVKLGVRWVRADLSWRNIQPDGPDSHRWERFDRVVAAVHARGLKILPILTYTPDWARPEGCVQFGCPPRDDGEFAAFAQAAVARYAPQGVRFWELWNEPNFPTFWTGPDARRYAALLRTSLDAIHATDPRAKVVLGGLAAVPTDEERGTVDPRDFLYDVCAAGACTGLHAVAFHPYTYPLLASDRHVPTNPWNAIARMEPSLRDILDIFGHRDMKLWLTEVGAPTGGPGDASDGTTYTATTTHVTEPRQAEIAADVVRTSRRSPHVAAMFWYTHLDHPRQQEKVDFYGLRRADATKKPAWRAFKRAIAD